MDDIDLVGRITDLADEERALEQGSPGRGLTDEERDRLKEVEVALDQCWDLLRQRRARRSTGQDPDDAAVRPGGVVEGYRQ